MDGRKKFPQKDKEKKILAELKNAGISGLSIRQTALSTGFGTTTCIRYLDYLEKNRLAQRIDRGFSKIFISPEGAISQLQKVMEGSKK